MQASVAYAYKASDGSGFGDEDACLYVALPSSVFQELQAQTSTMFVYVACCRLSKMCIERSCILVCNVTCNLRPITTTASLM